MLSPRTSVVDRPATLDKKSKNIGPRANGEPVLPVKVRSGIFRCWENRTILTENHCWFSKKIINPRKWDRKLLAIPDYSPLIHKRWKLCLDHSVSPILELR
jgi:hypothetical protein